MCQFVWTGPRESDIKYLDNFFEDSITIYGENENNNISFCKTQGCRINHNFVDDKQNSFMINTEMEMIRKHPDIKFMFYNPNLVFQHGQEVIKHTVCLNDAGVMSMLNSKHSFRTFARQYVCVLPYHLIKGQFCTPSFLKESFPGTEAWILQADTASGGEGTYLLNQENECQIRKLLELNRYYLVSPYLKKNISVNMHAIIYDDEIVTLQGSVQVVEEERCRLIYHGSDFIAYQKLNLGIRENFKNIIYALCEQIQEIGYRGVIGVDAIIANKHVMVLEANNRFQASTVLVNRAFHELGLRSMQELNLEAFGLKKKSKKHDISQVQIPYSLYAFTNINEIQKSGWNCLNKKMLNGKGPESGVWECLKDGYDENQQAEEGAYLYRVILNTNIVEIIDDRETQVIVGLKSC